jgi:Cu/Ag efflux pump CusA
MISSTFLTLLVVPVVYILVSKLRRRPAPVAAPFTAPSAEA